MRVKRYLVNEVSEALPLIRSELGKDAVILSTKDIKTGGFMGMFRKRMTEVVAAIESEGSKPNKSKAAAAPFQAAAVPARTANSAAAAYAGNTGNATAAATAVLDRPDPQITAERAAALLQAAAGHTSSVTADSAAGSIMSALAAGPQAANSMTKPSKSSKVTEDALVSEIRDMKEWIMKLSRQKELDSQPEAIKQLRTRLDEQEVASEWSDKLIDQLMEQIDEGADLSDTRQLWERASAILLDWLKPYEHPGIQPSDRAVYFVGPTGVGKTTTIAKLAAEQTLKKGKKVGFITSDTYRIAAVDQLRTYANILNVPMEVVFSPNEVPRAFERLEDRDVIFMDTAGRNYRSELHVSEVNSMMSAHSGNVFLVMSLTGRTKDMAIVAERFIPYGVRQAVFTKLDETFVYGSLLNIVLEYGLQPAYIASGQTVPDDIDLFQAEAYVGLLLGDPADV
ncbi:flagellar biosynthesis protein FlhF [Paenibacillus kobensis]|uniref:flagellar biosynthesis protein FlhF n=1 Tax=Paenibacillus kobensis TaxID=59841 RepID=UPI000FD7C246|nr:flagellar biosynthesis protein FlhF [Paenibacillus kobensis]